MDADNVTTPNFLAEINRAFESGLHAVQAHRTGKNMNTDIAVLDAISEEINNGFFRSGHNAIGLSAGLAGSGMAFDVHWFRRNVGHLYTMKKHRKKKVSKISVNDGLQHNTVHCGLPCPISRKH